MTNIKPTASQNLSQKRAEITFRKLITEQHRGLRVHFTKEFNRVEMRQELSKRLSLTAKDFINIKKRGIPFVSFLEIGAEYGVRSAFIESQFGAHGIALDIASTPLEYAPWFANQLELKKVPLRVCADCHSLPFGDNSFPFVFCYQTLHHFSDPLPVIAEIKRVLMPGGYFFFAEEPITQKYNLDLFRRPTKTDGLLQLLKVIPLLPFISKIGKTETDFGIYEGTIPVTVWRQIIKLFTPIDIQIDVFPFGHLTSSIAFSTWSWQQIILDIFGGGLKALLQKEAQLQKPVSKNKESLQFICPDCHAPLFKKTTDWRCTICQRSFIKKGGVLDLLPLRLSTSLYGKKN